MIYFKYDPKDRVLLTNDEYWIPVDELANEMEGRYFWFGHLIQKNWFTQNLQDDILWYCKMLELPVDIERAKLEMEEDKQMIELFNQRLERLGGVK